MYNVAKYRSAPACPGVSAATGATHATAVKTGYKEHEGDHKTLTEISS